MELLCLANSWKHHGRCIAGIDTDTGKWVRPVGPGDGALMLEQCCYADAALVRVLDVVRLPLSRPDPKFYQPENWRLGSGVWERGTPLTVPEIVALLRKVLYKEPFLFGDGERSVTLDTLKERGTSSSLALIYPKDITWIVLRKSRNGKFEESLPQNTFNRTQTFFKTELRARFRFQQSEYELSVTDPEWHAKFVSREAGEYGPETERPEPDPRFLFTVSLGEPFGPEQRCYKLIATVLPIPMEWRSVK